MLLIPHYKSLYIIFFHTVHQYHCCIMIQLAVILCVNRSHLTNSAVICPADKTLLSSKHTTLHLKHLKHPVIIVNAHGQI